MKKKIRVDQLRSGMFIHDFNCSWLRHPFCRNSLKVKNEKLIKRIIKSGIREVNIDTDRGLDIADVPAGDDIGKKIKTELRKVVRREAVSEGPVPVHDVPVNAKEISEEARLTIQSIMDDTGPDGQSETRGGPVQVHGEPGAAKENKQTELEMKNNIRPGAQFETQSGTVSAHGEPGAAKETKQTEEETIKNIRPGTKFETQSGRVSVNGEPGAAKETKQTELGMKNNIRSGTKPETESGTVSAHGEPGAAKETGQTVQEMMKIIRPRKELEIEIAPVPVQEELVKAKEIKMEAKKIVRDIMEDIKLGKQLEMKKVNNVVDKMVNSILRNKDALTGLGRIKKTDEYTFMHSVNVGILMVTFGKHLGFDCELLKTIGIGGLLHDMGKTKVPNELLTKKGRLSEEEMIKVKKHVEHSNNILKGTAGINEISVYVAAHHHERLDGTGYPNRLKAEDINIFGQMSAIVDVYDALTSDRCYQKGILPTLALKKLHGWKMYFNKELLHQFIRCIGIYPVGSVVRLQSGLLGVVLSHNEENLLYPVVRGIYDTKKNTYIMPFDIDLLEDFKKGGKDSVVCCELPDKWKIRPEAYL